VPNRYFVHISPNNDGIESFDNCSHIPRSKGSDEKSLIRLATRNWNFRSVEERLKVIATTKTYNGDTRCL
jgi:hypothetical protein